MSEHFQINFQSKSFCAAKQQLFAFISCTYANRYTYIHTRLKKYRNAKFVHAKHFFYGRQMQCDWEYIWTRFLCIQNVWTHFVEIWNFCFRIYSILAYLNRCKRWITIFCTKRFGIITKNKKNTKTESTNWNGRETEENLWNRSQPKQTNRIPAMRQ